MYKYPKVWNRSETGLKQANKKFESTIGEAWASLSSLSLLPLPAANGWVPNGGSKQKLAATTAWNHSLRPILWMKLAERHPRPQKSDSRCFFFLLDGAFLVLHLQGEKCQNRREWTSLHWLLIFQLVKSLFEQNPGSETTLNPRNSAHAPQQQPPSEEYRIPHFSIIHLWWVNSQNRSERWISETLLQECQVGYYSGVWGVGGSFFNPMFFLFKMLDAD